MKKAFLILVSVAMLLSSTAAFAEPKVTIGVKAWQNTWESTEENIFGDSETTDMGSVMMVGPSLNIKFNSVVFLGASYLTALDDYEYNGYDSYWGVDYTNKLERKDLDLTFGLMFGPYFGMFVGYKKIEADAKMTVPAWGVKDEFTGTATLSGPGIGILGNIPLGRSAAIYGSLAFMDITQEFKNADGTSDPEVDLTGISGEVGLAIAFSEVVSANIGFKAQSFNGDDDYGYTWEDEFSGITFGLNFTF